MLSASTLWNEAASAGPGCVDRTQRACIAREDLGQPEPNVTAPAALAAAT